MDIDMTFRISGFGWEPDRTVTLGGRSHQHYGRRGGVGRCGQFSHTKNKARGQSSARRKMAKASRRRNR